MKIAIVHDWLLNLGGAERVLMALHRIFPEVPIYTLFYDEAFVAKYFSNCTIRTSFCQKIPFINKIYPSVSFLFPTAIESLDFSEFDLVISSSVAFSKGVILKPKTKHICYCYSPTRFLWDMNSSDHRNSTLVSLYKHLMRLWDRSASSRVDKYLAISENVKNRISKYYRQESNIVYPPITIAFKQQVKTQFNNYYLIVSRLYKYKNIDVVIDAFNKLKYNLVIIGNGPDYGRLSKMAGENIVMLGFVEDNLLPSYYANCHAFVMPQDEDFGLTPIEAMTFGKPVLALRKGGAVEIISEGINGEFFDSLIPEAIADGVRRLENNYSKYDSEFIVNSTKKYSFNKFKENILKEILC